MTDVGLDAIWSSDRWILETPGECYYPTGVNLSIVGPITTSLKRTVPVQFKSDPAFLKAAETDLAGTLRAAGLGDVEIGRFQFSDTDEHGNSGTTPMGLKQIWICEIDGNSKRCWCTNCQNY